MLEEAAGITGLHARRHEAELKLRAAEANLARAEDLRGQLEAQLAGLKRQARQASRYRNISGAIREAEAELLALQRARAERAARRRPRRPCTTPETAVAAATEAATAGSAHARASAPQRCPRCAKPNRTPAPCWNATASRRSRSPASEQAAPAPPWANAERRSGPASAGSGARRAVQPRRRRGRSAARRGRQPTLAEADSGHAGRAAAAASRP